MRRRTVVLVLAAGLLPLLAAQGLSTSHAGGQLLANGPLPPVVVPVDNPMTDAKINLGKQLYFDGRLSSDGTISCASCHKPDAGWADKTPVSEGVGHQKGSRNSPSVINRAYIMPQFWDGRAIHLEKQAEGPVQNPIEMDLTEEQLERRLSLIPGYVEQFQQVFGSKPTIENVAKAIAAFERTIIVNDSPYDKYLAGDSSAMSPAALRGMRIFNGKGHCTACHSGPAFSDSRFHNLGVGYVDGKFKDVGRAAVTKNPADTGAFLTPQLRNVAETAPYLHDGSEPTLESVVEFYNRGGNANPYLDRAMLPLNLTDQEKRDLVEFLKALTGTSPRATVPPLPNPELTAQRLEEMIKEGGAK
ncbi:MAG: cytochrome-c peroxidase [Armatimonadota bacterium]